MTVLEEFECPNCGANVARPQPGQTITCPYCEAVLSEPERPEKVIVREIVHERVVERVEPETPAPDFRSSPDGRSTLRFVALGVVAVILLINQQIDNQVQETSCESNCVTNCM